MAEAVVSINFDFEKAFNSIQRESVAHSESLCDSPVHCPDHQELYHNFTCSVGSSSLNFQVKTGVCQGCVMSVVLFNPVIDWVMQHTTEDQPRWIRWTLFETLEDADFADDLALLSHSINTCMRRHAVSESLVNR